MSEAPKRIRFESAGYIREDIHAARIKELEAQIAEVEESDI